MFRYRLNVEAKHEWLMIRCFDIGCFFRDDKKATTYYQNDIFPTSQNERHHVYIDNRDWWRSVYWVQFNLVSLTSWIPHSIYTLNSTPLLAFASTLSSAPTWIMTCQCFLSSAISVTVVIWFLAIIYALSLALAISALICSDFVLHLLSSVISFSWPGLYPAFGHV